MKTITEFAGATLKNYVKTKQDLAAAGKTAEELPQAFGEALKLEGDKLGWALNAVELVEGRLDDLKRVIVFSLSEGEKAPKDAVQKGEQYFAAEYYPPLHPPKGKGHPPRGEEKKGRGDKRGGRGKRGDRDKNKNRGPRREKKE